MPIFEVYKGQDAYVDYVTVVEADDPKEARELVDSWEFEGDWRPTGNVHEFDDSTIYEENTRVVGLDTLELAEELLLKKYPDVTVFSATDAELDTIVAALNLYQAHFDSRTDPIIAIATSSGPDLSPDEITGLIQKIA